MSPRLRSSSGIIEVGVGVFEDEWEETGNREALGRGEGIAGVRYRNGWYLL